MFNGKDPRYYHKTKPHHRVYSQSDTSMQWETADKRKGEKQVKFDHNYEYPSRDSLYSNRKMNVNNYPSRYDIGNKYETRNNILEYDTEGSHYSDYYHPPHRTLYTETDSIYSTVDMSDSENDSFDHQPKYTHNYSQSYKKNNMLSEVSESEPSSFGGVASVYFVREPISHQSFEYEKQPFHKVTNQSESELQERSDTETDEESEYSTDSMGKNPDHQIYMTKVDESGTHGAFNKELQRNSQERLISVTNYDNIPVLAFKSKTTNVAPQKTMSGLVYLPVILMKNEEKLPTSKNVNTQLLPSRDCDLAGKSVQDLKVYTAVNTGQNNIFEKTNDNNQQTSTVLRSGINVPSQKSIHGESDLKTASVNKKNPYIYLPSVLKMSGAKKSKFSKEFANSQENRPYQNKTKKSRSNNTITFVDSSVKAENDFKDPAKISKKEAKDTKEIKENKHDKSSPSKESKNISKHRKNNLKNKCIESLQKERILNGKQEEEAKVSTTLPKSKELDSTPVEKYNKKKDVSKKKSNTSNTSQKSAKSVSSTPRKSRARKRNGSRTSQKSVQSAKRLIGKSPSGSVAGSSFFAKAHKKELERRAQARSNSSKSQKSARSIQSPINKSHKNDSKVKTENSQKKKNLTSLLEHSENSQISKLKNQNGHDFNKSTRLSIILRGQQEPTTKNKSNENQSVVIPKQQTITSSFPKNPSIIYKKEADISQQQITEEKKNGLSILAYGPKFDDEKNQHWVSSQTPHTDTRSKATKNVGDIKHKNVIENQDSKITQHKVVESKPKSQQLQTNDYNIQHTTQTVQGTKNISTKEISEGKESQKPRHRSTRKIEMKSVEEIMSSKQNGVIENQGTNRIIDQHKLEESKQISQSLDPNQIVLGNRRKSIGKEIITTEQSKNLSKKSMGNEYKSPSYINNQTVQGDKKSLVRKTTRESEHLSKNITITGVSQPFMADQEERRGSIVSLKQPTENVERRNEKNVIEIYKHPQRNMSLRGEKNSIHSEYLQGESTTVQNISSEQTKRLSKQKSLTGNDKTFDSGQRDLTQETPLYGNIRKKDTLTDSIYTTHQSIEQKHDISNGKNFVQQSQSKQKFQKDQKKDMGRGASRSIKKDMDRGASRSIKKNTSPKQNIISKSISHKKSNAKRTSQVKRVSTQQSKYESERTSCYTVKLWGYDCSSLLINCFRVAQFFLGVSTYDKLIEVLGNFQ